MNTWRTLWLLTMLCSESPQLVREIAESGRPMVRTAAYRARLDVLVLDGVAYRLAERLSVRPSD